MSYAKEWSREVQQALAAPFPEEWRRTADSAYEVSRSGQVRRVSPLRRNGRPYPQTTLKPVIKHGYAHVSIRNAAGQFRHARVHQLVAAAFLGPAPTGTTPNHKNLNKLDNRADNLEYCTPIEQMRHALENGAIPLGLAHHKGKLSAEQVIEFRSRFLAGEAARALGREYGISRAHAQRLATGRSRQYIEREARE